MSAAMQNQEKLGRVAIAARVVAIALLTSYCLIFASWIHYLFPALIDSGAPDHSEAIAVALATFSVCTVLAAGYVWCSIKLGQCGLAPFIVITVAACLHCF